MPRNIEIKARASDLTSLARKVAAIANSGPTQLLQDDTFFRCEAGRLKLRAFSEQEGELIFYRREDRAGPKEPFYIRSPTAAPESLRHALTLALGQVGRVRKRRTLFLIGRTRVHLDRVENLGEFMELEVVLEEGETLAAGIQEANAIMERLGVAPQHLVEEAYVDLLARRGV
jgi:predicted adenylyl cyclase CyaB